MRLNLPAIAGSLVSALLAAVVAVQTTTRVLPEQDPDYTVRVMLTAAGIVAAGGVVGVVVGWLINGRRPRGLGGIAAVTTVVGAFAGTIAWGMRMAALDETGLFIIGAILLLGASTLTLALACGMTAAVLSSARE